MHLGEGLNPGLLALSRLLSWAEPNEWVIQDSVRRAVAMSNSKSFIWHWNALCRR